MAEWILVPDGDAEARMELFRLLEACGYQATVVDSGKLALEMLRSEPFDLALVDVTGQGLASRPRAVKPGRPRAASTARPQAGSRD